MKSVALFDLDGTLVDTPQAITEAIATVISDLQAPEQPTQKIRGTIGRPLEVGFAELLDSETDSGLVNEAVQQYKELFRQTILPRAQSLVFPGVIDGLTKLQGAGLTLTVATSKVLVSANQLLTACHLAEFFHLVVGADQVSRPKPAPEMVEKILEELELLPNSAVMIGDTVHDVEMGKAAGLNTIAVAYGVHTSARLADSRPDSIVNSFDEVVNQILHMKDSMP